MNINLIIRYTGSLGFKPLHRFILWAETSKKCYIIISPQMLYKRAKNMKPKGNRRILSWKMDRSGKTHCLAREIARSYTVGFLSMGNDKGDSVSRKNWFETRTDIKDSWCIRWSETMKQNNHETRRVTKSICQRYETCIRNEGWHFET